MRISVVIPTWQRPDWLARCVNALATQELRPHQLVLVRRDDDAPTALAIAELARRHPTLRIDEGVVTAPGFIPPLLAGRALVARDADAVSFIDDDGEALPDWLARIGRALADPSVGGVGGRIHNLHPETGIEIPFPPAERVGQLDLLGRVHGNMYRAPAQPGARDVEFLAGCNMTYRRDVLMALEIDQGLSRDVAFHYEVDWGLQIRAMGWRLVWDPEIRVLHHSAPRAQSGLRETNAPSIEAYAYNLTRILARRLPPGRRALSLAYFLIVGDRKAWGPIAAAADVALTRRARFLGSFAASQAGKLKALADVFLSRVR